jgi:hypothetical protein
MVVTSSEIKTSVFTESGGRIFFKHFSSTQGVFLNRRV